MDNILIAVLVLGAIGAVFSVLLYVVAQKFKVEEDPLIDEIADVLPGANCGCCGKSGCRAMAEAFVRQGNMKGLRCPVGGDAVAQQVAHLLKCAPVSGPRRVAVVRCGTCFDGSAAKTNYDGLRDCTFASNMFVGTNGCPFGCLGLGSCVNACKFGALSLHPETHAPVVDENRCTACGSCVKACPRGVIELRDTGVDNRRVYVACVSKERGAEARKVCQVACIGCGKCQRTCPHDAVHVQDNVAYVDFNKCEACGKCVIACPTGALRAVNFTPSDQSDAETVANNDNHQQQ